MNLSTLLRMYKDTEEEVLDTYVIYVEQDPIFLMDALDVVNVNMICVWTAIKNDEVCQRLENIFSNIVYTNENL